MKSFRILSALIITLAAAIFAHAAPVQRIHEIQSPIFNIPAIVPAGQSFTLKLKPADAEPAVAYLEGIDTPSTKIELKLAPKADENGLKVFAASVPAGTPEALYNLKVRFDNSRLDAQPHAVKVISEFKKDFDFVQITDIHFNVQDVEGQDMNRIRRRILEDASKEKAEFIILTGDLGLDPETYERDYLYSYPELTQNVRLPIFIVPGNHEQYYIKPDEGEEIDGVLYWTANYGPTHHSFDYGKVHFIGINTFDWPRQWRNRRDNIAAFAGTIINSYIAPQQWQWVKSDLEDAHKRGQSCIAYTHIPISILQGGRRLGMPPNYFKAEGPGTKEFTETLANEGCSHIFLGHMHYNQENAYGSLTEVLTGAAGIGFNKREPKWMYRVIHVRDGKVAGWDDRKIGFEDLK